MRIESLRFMVGIVVPSLGRTPGHRIPSKKQESAIEKIMKAFEEWFGGATPMKIPPGGIVRRMDGTVLLDSDQVLVLAGTTRKEYRRRRRAIDSIAAEVGKYLDQESMCVLVLDTSEVRLVFPGLP